MLVFEESNITLYQLNELILLDLSLITTTKNQYKLQPLVIMILLFLHQELQLKQKQITMMLTMNLTAMNQHLALITMMKMLTGNIISLDVSKCIVSQLF